MLIRKNTKAFKTLLEIVATCQSRPDREKLIRLYITKAGHSIEDRINVEGIQGEAGLFYDMTYQTVLSNLQSSNHQLVASDDHPGIYFFHTTSNKIWDETPFEFDEAVLKEFSSLPELPVVRKKGKAEKYTFPAPKQETSKSKNEKAASTGDKSKTKIEPRHPSRTVEKGPKQPDFKLKHEIHFSNLDKVIFRTPHLNKRSVLEYYDQIASFLLPYVKDRHLCTRRDADTLKPSIEMNPDSLFPDKDDRPDWIKQTTISEGKQKRELLLCNDKEHLLLYVEAGCLEFDHSLSKIKSSETPDYMIIGIDSPDFEIAKAIDVALAAREIFDGLQLRSTVKTDGISGLHVYFPLEPKCSFETSSRAAEYICKLIKLKVPDLVSLEGSDENAYGKVSLNYAINAPGQTVVAPYSLVPGQLATVATPLTWDEIKEGLRLEEFNYETIFKRLKQVGDPLDGIRKKVDGEALLERLEENYSFLF